MRSFYIVYGTGEGQTAKVASRIADVLTDRGHQATTVDVSVRNGDVALEDVDAVLVGSSIHAGKQQSTVRKFVQVNRDTLAGMPTAFFQVSLSSADEQGAEQAAGYVETFIEETGWHPDRIGLFGGALRYSEYGFLKRLLMKQIAKRTVEDPPDPDPAGDIEFTDWNEVEAFAADIAAFVEGRLGVTPPESDPEIDSSSDPG
ncbi:flavodoxin domain-containing protein [Natrialbaceae archaeon A-CW1-1]